MVSSGHFLHIVLPIVIPDKYATLRDLFQSALLKIDGEPSALDVWRVVKGNIPPPDLPSCSMSAYEYFSFLLEIAQGYRSCDQRHYEDFFNSIPTIASSCRCDERVIRSFKVFSKRKREPKPIKALDILMMSVNQSPDVIRAGIVNGILQKKGENPRFSSLTEEQYKKEVGEDDPSVFLNRSYDVNVNGAEKTVIFNDVIEGATDSFDPIESREHMVTSVLAAWKFYRNVEIVDRKKLLEFVSSDPGTISL